MVLVVMMIMILTSTEVKPTVTECIAKISYLFNILQKLTTDLSNVKILIRYFSVLIYKSYFFNIVSTCHRLLNCILFA